MAKSNESNGLRTIPTLLLCLFSALLLGLSQPIFFPEIFGEESVSNKYFGLLSLFGYAPLLWVVARKNLRATYLWATFTISLQFSISLAWIYIPLHVYGMVPPLSSVLITYSLALVLALKTSIFILLGRYLSIHFKRSFFIFAPLSICTAEYFRNYHIFGGFPWGNVGYSIGRIDEFLQLASLIGVYGLVFFVVTINSLICMCLQRAGSKKIYLPAGIIFLMIVSVYFAGMARINWGKHNFAPSIKVALLQGNISQEIKNKDRYYSSNIISIYSALSEKAQAKGAELIVMPETSYPRIVPEDSDYFTAFNEKVVSIIGAATYGKNHGSAGGNHYHNSALIVDADQKVVKRYDKSHLVPFGEYVPWPLSGMVAKVVPGIGAWRPGKSFAVVDLKLTPTKSVRVGTTVCYEGIFPEITRMYARDGAQMMVNITNDAWYGRSSAPFQHLLMYRLRAVESGRPIIRATNTGVSGWVDLYGQVHRASNLFDRGLIVDDVPILTKDTVYLFIGDAIPVLSLIILLVLYVMAAVPVKSIFLHRDWRRILVLVSLVMIAGGAHVYYSQAQFLTNESAGTKSLFISIYCLLIMVGSLSQTGRSRKIMITCSFITIVGSIVLSIFESIAFLWGILLGILIYLIAFRMKKTSTLTK